MDLPGQVVRGKASVQYPVLKVFLDKLKAGRDWKDQGTHSWHSLQELVEENPQLEEAMDLLGITKYTSLWRLLKQAQPGLRMSAMKIKGSRECKQAQSAAKQILGQEDVVFDVKAHEHPRNQRVLKKGYSYRYKYKQLLYNVFLDAGKIEPQRWLRAKKVLTSLGWSAHAVTHLLLMKSVCPQPPHTQPGTIFVYEPRYQLVATCRSVNALS